MPVADPREVLKRAKVVAVVGASRNPEKDAGRVPTYLKEKGYRIIPVNPRASEILGEKAYPSLDDIPLEVAREIDVVDVFRPPSEAVAVVEAVERLRRRTGRNDIVLWFQPGTESEEALRRAEDLGITVVYGKCMMMEHKAMTRG